MRHLKHYKRNSILIAILVIVGWGLISRYLAYSELSRHAQARPVPSVITIRAKAGAAMENIVLPANVQAWHEAPVFARTNGYIKRWITDIGAEVKEGDLLAEIETPEVDAQLHQAEADLHTAEANNALSQVTAKRWLALLKTNSVSKQEVDEKVSDAKAKEALMASARANYDRLEELESFKRLVAPFDGTITARNIDDGSLINAGSSPAQELFHIADVHKLRVYVQVPQVYAIALKPGFTVEVHFTEYPGKNFMAMLISTAGALDPVTRTLLLEFALDNAKKELLSGGYAEVHMQLPLQNSSVLLPVNVLLFRSEGLRVASVTPDNHVALKAITIHRDFGNEFEVSSGIEPGEQIIINPPDSIEDGQEVNVITPKEDMKKDKKP